MNCQSSEGASTDTLDHSKARRLHPSQLKAEIRSECGWLYGEWGGGGGWGLGPGGRAKSILTFLRGGQCTLQWIGENRLPQKSRPPRNSSDLLSEASRPRSENLVTTHWGYRPRRSHQPTFWAFLVAHRQGGSSQKLSQDLDRMLYILKRHSLKEAARRDITGHMTPCGWCSSPHSLPSAIFSSIS